MRHCAHGAAPALGALMLRHLRGAGLSRNARTRCLAAVVALRDRGHQRLDEQALGPAPCRRCAAARACTAKFDSGALRGDLARRARRPWRSPCPSPTTYCDRPIAEAFVGVVDAAGQHHVGHPRGADQARDARRAAAADEDAALALRQRRRTRSARRRGCARRRRARVRRRRPRRAAPRRPGRGRTGSLERRMPRARMDARPRRRCAPTSSDRSSPAQKCSPSPLSTTARVSTRAG